MGAIIGHVFFAILEIVAELVFLLTGKWLLLLALGGRLVLMPSDIPRILRSSDCRTDRAASTANLRC